ncbi:lysophospholipase L1-like esterase [Kineothrix alysoides]|uniref:Lysophospholipase L1-like esterase n=1 Tax=Kineothrix alysoides TaxID=1469948 RepID=A0A4R1R1Y3_9FIRM|nr:SGNH/GDSL hydrolase family protein [Kineothrix alysoides]TCL59318.1 lysophospholipase L1-like esterase [Kineothrix alysoides]
MKSKKRNMIYMAAMVLAFALMLTSCAASAGTEENTVENISNNSSEQKDSQDNSPQSGTAQEEGSTQAEDSVQNKTDAQREGNSGDKTSMTDDEAKNEEQQPLSPWAGKKVSICGDSISTFTGFIPDYYSKFYPENGDITDVNDTWWMQVIKRTGMELCRNASFSGSTVSGQSQDNHEGRYSCGNQRMADLASEEGDWPDIIIILMGANDLLNHIPLGAYNSASAVEEGYIQTFSEAYALMLDKMKTWYPDAEIYCCTIAEVSRWNDAGEKFPFMNEHGLTVKDYNAWITAIAQEKGAKLIDVYNCGITYENAQEYTSDGTHPNAAGAKLIADKVCETFQ